MTTLRRLRRSRALNDPLLSLALGLAGLIRHGTLGITLPDGSVHLVDGGAPGPSAELAIHDRRLPLRLLAGGNVALAEAYVDGMWSSPDLAAVMRLAAANEAELQRLLSGNRWARIAGWIAHRLRRNSRRGSRRNISAHYDLGNDFYAAWLDPTMSYSSAVFADAPAEKLPLAQARKVEMLCRALALKPGSQLLEFGCGWGFFAETAAREFGAQVLAITLSREQFQAARRRVFEAGLAERVQVRLADYREVTGRFDAIAAVEMIEAVGERYWPTFFATVRERLVPGGLAGIQAITIDERIWPDYRRNPDFIQRHVFPGGMLPTKTLLRDHARRAGLEAAGEAWFGASYAETLARWRTAFLAAWPRIEALPPSPTGRAFDARFRLLWEYYLSYCETGFRAGWTDVGQLVLRRG
jgi:cyclopropane-fatty-acyl-phospholipid synthase